MTIREALGSFYAVREAPALELKASERKAWLAKAEHGAPPPSFCPNAALFDGLRPR